VVDELGSREEVEYVYKMLENGTGADRQLEVYNKTKDYKSVVDFMIGETAHGLWT
jgi:glutamate---cysteine ligase / carboxylate-amine ligase